MGSDEGPIFCSSTLLLLRRLTLQESRLPDDHLPLPAPMAVGTPTKRMSTKSAASWEYNEDADIMLLCLRLFSFSHRLPARATARLDELLPCMKGEPNGALEFFLPASPVRPEQRQAAVTAASFVDWLQVLLQSKQLPVAALNAPKVPFADSFLVLRLCQPAPRDFYPLLLPNARREKEFKEIRPAHQTLLAVFIQSKLHGGSDPANESFSEEYAKCLPVPIPFVFVFLSDAKTVTNSRSLSFPYNGNGYFVGRKQPDKSPQQQRTLAAASCNLEDFYGPYLYAVRTEAYEDSA